MTNVHSGKVPVLTSSPDVLGGTPVFATTRVPIQTFIEYLEGGQTIDDFLEGFLTVSRDQIIAVLEEAKTRIPGPRQENRGARGGPVPQAGWAGIKNGDWLALAQQQFDVFVTIDRNLSFQQNLPQFNIAVFVLAAPTNRLNDLGRLVLKLHGLLGSSDIRMGKY